MASAPDPNGGGPVIAGDPISCNEYEVYSDEDVNNFFLRSPDTLQTQISSDEPKLFIQPQELNATGPPESLTNSPLDDSSDCASAAKQSHFSMFTQPSAPGKAEDGPLKEWRHLSSASYGNVEAEACVPARERNHGSFESFSHSNKPDNMMVDSLPWGLETTSGGLDPCSTQLPLTLSDISMMDNQSTQQAGLLSMMGDQGHKERPSRFPAASSRAGRKREASRDPSPVSTWPAGRGMSPSATLQNNTARTGSDVSQANNLDMWTNNLGFDPSSGPEGNLHPGPWPAMTQGACMPHFTNNPQTFDFCGGYDFKILPTPLKSRVETQIPITMVMNPLPAGITKLHLPPHTISKPKLLAKPRPGPSPDTLELFVSLVCTSAMGNAEYSQNALERAARTPQGHLPDLSDEVNAPQNGGEVRICAGCITRERKRAARKKTRKPEEDKLWSDDEERRVIVFNTHEIKDWQPCGGQLDANGRPESMSHGHAMQIDAPMRIACYCRHHHEKMGFNVIFTLKDWKGRAVAQAVSNPIMITDDHKTSPVAQMTTPPSLSLPNGIAPAPAGLQQQLSLHMGAGSNAPPPAAANVGFNGFSPPNQTNGRSTLATIASRRTSPSLDMGSGSNPSCRTTPCRTTPVMTPATMPGTLSSTLSRPSSPGQIGHQHCGHFAKKRKSSACTSRVPNELAMTRLDTSPALTPGATTAANSIQASAVDSPFSPKPSRMVFAQTDALFEQQSHQVPFLHDSLVPNSPELHFFANRRSESVDNLPPNQPHSSAPTSSHTSRAPSPNGLRNAAHNLSQAQRDQLSQPPIANAILPMSTVVARPRPAPIIHKIIPSQGPTVGGVEVTVLGASFHQGLEVWFGDVKATTTTYWGDSSLVCLLPPSPEARIVHVSFGQSVTASEVTVREASIFKYIDDCEDRIIRTALSVLGLKMSGKVFDVSDLARRILSDSDRTSWALGNGNRAHLTTNGHRNLEHLETQLLKVLDLIDLDSSGNRARLDHKRSTGHTMLHLACSLGYHRLVAALLARGANKNALDNGGFTPLHLAAIHNHPELVKRLMIAGADLKIRSLSGLTVKDVAQSRAVERTIRSSHRHMRSQSGGLFQSRTASITSMGSLWEPLTKVHTHQGLLSVDSSEESLEYTSGDFEDEDPDEDVGLSMRQLRRLRLENDGSSEGSEELNSGLASNTTSAMAAAFKEQIHTQFQQLQQAMGLYIQHFANLPQVGIPQMRTFPALPMLPDYQAFLPQTPFMRRMQQLVPGMSGNHAETPTNDGQPKMDSRWWDISSYSKSNPAGPPPAYDEIFPQGDLDTKILSAARAAADAEADLKCATLSNEASASVTGASSSSSPPQPSSSKAKKIPTVLEIGRKNAITREQQDNFLRAREQKLKMLSNDRNLFMIWIPLLLIMICALLYSYFPSFFTFLWTSACALVLNASDQSDRVMQNMPALNRVGEV